MEDDDEFGDLYTDVLQPFASSFSSPSPPPITNPPLPSESSIPKQQRQQQHQSPQQPLIPQSQDASSQDLNPTNEEPDADSMHNDVKFDIEDDAAANDNGIGSEPVIPGLSSAAVAEEASGRIDERGDDWDDSDSDDDLRIVLNDNSLMALGRADMAVDGDGGGDEDGGLNIVTGGDPNSGAEEQEWGESAAAQTVDGERKDAAELGKGAPPPLKTGYGGHQGYHHQFHSHFKYVRPGAAPMPGSTTAPGGPPSQIRPLANVNPGAGRGRGDWRPAGIKGAAAMQKGFQSGTGVPVWANSAAGRGFGGGLDFTLPSHKTIFDVDIDSFEEKPWKYPGVDVSVFFNFDLNEDSWKDYSKQLEQLRMESTMQSKIRVYESGRTEQEFDPDLPPELAAAAGVHDVAVGNANSIKSDVGQSHLANGSGPVRPPIPTGRAIQVEGGYGERLPSIDTRPPRMRDSDAIIEIVLQDTADDDSSVGIDAQDQPEDVEPQSEDFKDDNVVEDEIPKLKPEYFAGFPKDYNGRKRELVGRRMPFMNSNLANIPDEDENVPFQQEDLIEYSDSMRQTPRQMQGRVHAPSPHISPRQEMTIVDNKKEESVASMEDRHGASLSSPVDMDARVSSMENKDAELEESGTADGSSRMEKEDIDVDTIENRDTIKDEIAETEKLTSQVEQPFLDEGDDWEDSKAARNSDNSKARSASSRGYQKQRDGFEEEVVQDPRSMHRSSIGRQSNENEQVFDRRDHRRRQEPERNCMVQAREESWMQRDDDLYSIRGRNDEPRKRDRGKVRENERSHKDDSIHSRKQLDNGSYRVTFDKDVGSRVSRHRGRDGALKGRHEAVEDSRSKKRKDEEYLRREHIDKEEGLHGYRENASWRRRERERDEALDLRKRDGHQRSRDNLDDQYAARQKDEALLLRERGDRQRDRQEQRRLKPSHEELPSKRERQEGRSSVRSGRGIEEKTWVGHVRAKDELEVSEKEYQSVEVMQHSDQLKRRDRVLGVSPHPKGRDDAYARGIQYSNEEKRPRQEKSSRHSDRVSNASDNHRVHERNRKEGSRKSKEPVIGSSSSLGMSKRSQEDQSGQINEKVFLHPIPNQQGSKGSGDEEHVEHEIPRHRKSRKHPEDISSDDEQQGSQQGRSKLERWTSHKERDFSISSKSSSSSKFNDLDKDNNDGSSQAGKPADESAKILDTDNQDLLFAEGKDCVDMDSKDADTKGLGDRHLDTAEKLKKRSERFKLPLPSEKESIVTKQIESEPLPSAKSENPVDTEVKQERPARKRRWISN